MPYISAYYANLDYYTQMWHTYLKRKAYNDDNSSSRKFQHKL